jgi:hypothetical protein
MASQGQDIEFTAQKMESRLEEIESRLANP